MPVQCEIVFPRLTNDDMKAVDYRVMGHAFATHNELGCLADEAVYQREFLRRLRLDGIEAAMEVPVQLTFRTFAVPLRLDLVVDGKVIYELKTASALNSGHESQLLGYLYLTNSTHGKLVNFRPRSVQSRFVNTTLDGPERRKFEFDHFEYDGPEHFSSLVHDLVEDWGTGLDCSLYRRAILHCTRQGRESEQLLPMVSSGTSVGNQRFHMLDGDTAIGVTSYPDHLVENKRDFAKLIKFSPLKRFYWINIVHHHVHIATIKRSETLV